MTTTQTIFSKIVVLVIGIALLVTVGFAVTNKAKAFTLTITGTLHGYAWSSTTGWISLNCAEGGGGGTSVCSTSNYLVARTSTGSLLGTAWSSNLGWLSFNASDTSSCATGSTQAMFDLTTNRLSGWAKFLSGDPTTGWDGCVKLKSTGTEPAYGVIYTPGAIPNIIGNAWGSTVVGWVAFYATYSGGTASVDLKINGSDGPLSLGSAGTTPTSPTVLSYTTSGVTSCSGSGLGASSAPSQSDWSSSTGTLAGGQTTPIVVVPNTGTSAVSHTYTITCTNGTTSSSDSVVINVAPAGVGGGTCIGSACIDFKINGGYGPVTLDSGVSGVTLSWTTQNIQPSTCSGTSSPSYTGWNGAKTSSIPSTTFTYATGILTDSSTHTQNFTISGCLPVGGTTAIPSLTRVVNFNLPSCRVVGPTFPSLMAGTGGTLSGTTPVNFGVVWDHTGGVFHPATLSQGTAPAGLTVTSFGHMSTSPVCANGFSLNGSHPTSTSPGDSECTGVTVAGTITGTTNLNLPISATASPAVPGMVGTACTPANLEIVPPGGTSSGTGTSGPKTAPWQEF